MSSSNTTMCADEMDVSGCELTDLLVFHTPSDTPYWSREATLALLDIYRQDRPRVGSEGFRRMHNLCESASHRLKKVLGKYFTPAQCENRWRVLERNYKKVVDNNKSSGRGRKTFEFEKEMEEIFQKKANIHPELLLSGQVVAETPEPVIREDFLEPGPSESGPSNSICKEAECPAPPSKKRKITKKRSPGDALLEDRKNYHRERLEMERGRNKEREQREEENLQTNRAILQELKETKELQREMVKQMTDLTAVFRKYTEYRMSFSGYRLP